MRLHSLLLLTFLQGSCVGTIEDVGDDQSETPDAALTNSDSAIPPGQDAAGSLGDGASVADAATNPLTVDEIDLFDALNGARLDNGLAAIVIDDRLMCAARKHALDVGGNGSCDHVGSDGSWPWDRAEACGFPQDSWTVNEIAAGPGFESGEEAVWGWSHSSGHWAAIVHPQAVSVGVAVHNTCYIALFDCCVDGS